MTFLSYFFLVLLLDDAALVGEAPDLTDALLAGLLRSEKSMLTTFT